MFLVLGKGRRPRACPLGDKTGQAVERYPASAASIAQTLRRRAKLAGVEHLHPHMFRHTFAHRWLADGGREQDLLRLAGWRSPEMLGRYGASAADQHAREAPPAGRRPLGRRLGWLAPPHVEGVRSQ